MFKILVVEDNIHTRKLLTDILREDGYEVHVAMNGEQALSLLDCTHIDLMISDIMMPRMDGYQLVRELRDVGNSLPILMLTAKQTPENRREGFLVGADDYVSKPFDEQELLLRVKALLRRTQVASEHKLYIGDTMLDYDALTVPRQNHVETLPPKEFYLLYKLLSSPNRIFTRMELLDEIWGMDSDSADTTVNVHINRIRTKFADCSDFEIVTVRGLGYKAVQS